MIMVNILIDILGDEPDETDVEKKELKSKPLARPPLPLRKQVININGEVVEAP